MRIRRRDRDTFHSEPAPPPNPSEPPGPTSTEPVRAVATGIDTPSQGSEESLPANTGGTLDSTVSGGESPGLAPAPFDVEADGAPLAPVSSGSPGIVTEQQTGNTAGPTESSEPHERSAVRHGEPTDFQPVHRSAESGSVGGSTGTSPNEDSGNAEAAGSPGVDQAEVIPPPGDSASAAFAARPSSSEDPAVEQSEGEGSASGKTPATPLPVNDSAIEFPDSAVDQIGSSPTPGEESQAEMSDIVSSETPQPAPGGEGGPLCRTHHASTHHLRRRQ